MQFLYYKIIGLLNLYQVPYKEYYHDPILSYADAERQRHTQGWHGIESKNVFLKDKKGNFYVYVTTADKKVDFETIKQITGEKCSLATHEEVKNVINCVPGCVTPFGFPEHVQIIVDKDIYQNDDYLFSPGVTTKTIQANIKDLKTIFENLPNKVTHV